jgi:hypothetical protein
MEAGDFATTFAVCVVLIILLLGWMVRAANQREARKRLIAAQQHVDEARQHVEDVRQRVEKAQAAAALSLTNMIRITSESPVALEFLGQFTQARSVAYLAATGRNWSQELDYDYKEMLEVYCSCELLAKAKRYGEDRYILTGKGALLVVTFSNNEQLKTAARKRL